MSDRPWPVPRVPWAMAMRWEDLLFAHWAVDPSALRRLLPQDLELDLHEGKAWLGVVPFRMSGVRARGTPAIPGLSAFPELNVRTYVVADDKPGVWFFSLDAAHRLAVRVARWSFGLPYFDARMRIDEADGGIDYESHRTHVGAAPAELVGSYRPIGPVYRSEPGTLDHFLTERYCLYSAIGSRVFRGEIDHVPWPLQPAEARFEVLRMTNLLGLELPDEPPILHFAKRIDVRAWLISRVPTKKGEGTGPIAS